MKRYSISLRLCTKSKAEERKLISMRNISDGSKKSMKGPQFPQIECQLLTFISDARTAGLSIARKVIHVRSLSIRDKPIEDIQDEIKRKRLESFSASHHWVQTFVKRNGLRSVTLHGEAGIVDQ